MVGCNHRDLRLYCCWCAAVKLLFCSAEADYVIENLSAGDAVWLTMNSRGMTAEKFLAHFPDAVKQERRVVGRTVGYIAFDEDFK